MSAYRFWNIFFPASTFDPSAYEFKCLVFLNTMTKHVHAHTHTHTHTHTHGLPGSQPTLFPLLPAPSIFFFLGRTTQHARSYFPTQGWNPCPPQWKLGDLTTGPPAKSPPASSLDIPLLSAMVLASVYKMISLPPTPYSEPDPGSLSPPASFGSKRVGTGQKKTMPKAL